MKHSPLIIDYSPLKKVPEIRFKGENQSWKEFELGEVVSYVKGYAFKSSDYELNGTRIIRVSDLSWDSVSESTSKVYLNKSNELNYSNYKINSGDIVITTVGSKSYLRESAVGRAIFFTGSKGYLLNQNLVKITSLNNYDSQFIYSQLLREPYSRYIENIERGNANQANIAISDLWEYKIKFPVLQKEQAKIGSYFKELDRMIGLHQRKHDKLLTLKQAMLQKMFPQDGATTPQIRFKGFDGDWVERKLSDVCEIVGGGTPSTSIREYWGGDIDWYSPTEIGSEIYVSKSVKQITQLGFEKCSAKILPADRTVLFTSRAGIGDMALLKKDGSTNQGFQSFILHDAIDSYFVYSMGYLIKDFALKHASGSTFLEISSKLLGKMEILIPNKSEQQKIGTYFRQLDALISKHTTQLEKLKQLKSACLEKMFV